MDLTALHRFHIAPGGNPADATTWVWVNRSQDVDHVDGGIRYSAGRGDEISQVDTGVAQLRVDNAGGHYCTKNPNGRWYGKLARNCPARWGVIVGAADWTTTVSNGWPAPSQTLASTSWVLAGSASDWSSSGGTGRRAIASAGLAYSAELSGAYAYNGDATFVVSSAVIATGGPLIYGFQARYSDGSDHLMFNVELSTSGSISAKIRRQYAGVLTTLAANEPLSFTYSVNQRIKARCQWEGPNLRLKVWPEASGEPDAWTVVATDSLCGGSGLALRFWRFAANSNAGALTFFVDDLEIEAIEIIGTVPEWPVRWDSTAQTSWAPIQIAGTSRRLSQGAQPLRSPIYRQLIAQRPAAYWALEDGSESAQAGSALTRGRTAVAADVAFGNSDAPPGASASVTLNTVAASRLTGQVTSWPLPTDGYAVMFYYRQPALVAGATHLRLFEVLAAGRVVRWVVGVANLTMNLTGLDVDGTAVVSTGAIVTSADPTRWQAIQLECEESGGNVNWRLVWHQVGSTTFYNVTGSYAGAADRVSQATAFAPVDGTLVSHLWIGDDQLPFVDTTFQLVSAGYAGELASDRVARLCREEGIPVFLEPGPSEPLGVQRTATLLELLRVIEAADMGILYEVGTAIGYRPRGARFHQPQRLALSMAATGDVSEAAEATDDDLRVRNEWTVSRDGGSDATYADADHIFAEGRYPDTATINIETDARLSYHAEWRVHLGTWGELRWPQITVDFTDRPALLARWLGRPFGVRFTVSGVPSQGAVGADLDLFVEGFTEEISSHSWRVTLNCSPARPWDIGIWNGGRKWSSSSTTTGSTLPAATGSTSLTLSTAVLADLWHTASTGYRIVAAGEEMTVTAMGSPSGTGPWTQVATVTRAANGIVKAHALGEVVKVAEAYRARFKF